MPNLNKTKLTTLCEIEGYDNPTQLMEDYVHDSVCPSICMNDGCDYTSDLEPDQSEGWCEECGTNSLKSAFVLAGVI